MDEEEVIVKSPKKPRVEEKIIKKNQALKIIKKEIKQKIT